MPSFASINLIGHVGRDAEIRAVGDTSVAEFSVAISHKRKDVETTSWWRCKLFGDRAQKLAKWITKGKLIAVAGEPSLREYEKDGVKKISAEVVVSSVVFLSGSNADGKPAEAGEAQKPIKPERDPVSSDNEPPF